MWLGGNLTAEEAARVREIDARRQREAAGEEAAAADDAAPAVLSPTLPLPPGE